MSQGETTGSSKSEPQQPKAPAAPRAPQPRYQEPQQVQYQPVAVQAPAPVPRVKKQKDIEARVKGRSDLYYTWPLILVGFMYPLILAATSQQAATWTWIVTLTVVILTCASDWNRIVTLIMILITAFCWVGIVYLNSTGVTIFKSVYNFFAEIEQPDLTPVAAIMALLCLICFISAEIQSFLNNRWSFRPNVISRLELFEGEAPVVQGQNVPEFLYPDLWELLLGFGAGTIVITNNQSHEQHRIKNVLFLWFRKRRIRRICHTQQVTVRSED